MSAHTASREDTTDARPPAYLGGSNAEIQAPGRCLIGDLCHYPGIGGRRHDHASANQTVVMVAGNSSRAICCVAGSGRRRHARYSPAPSVIVLHA